MIGGRSRPAWIAPGDLNGFFALSVDNLALLGAMSAILVGGFQLPGELVIGRMLPGSALGVLLGDVAFSVLAIRLARREGRADVCAMPLGIDTPSMFGLCFGVVGPAWLATHDADRTLAISTAVLALMGVGKTIAAFFGDTVRRRLPRTAMLGALAAVAIALIAFFSVEKIVAEPLGGMVALGVVLSTLVAGRALPGRVPAMAGAIALGLCAWAASRWLGFAPAPAAPAMASFGWHLPLPTRLWIDGLGAALPFLPLALPFALATLVGGIDNTESAAAAGDPYRARDVLLVEGITTFAAATCGGVLQTTPYIGHPAYKRMGCRAGYTAATACFIGLGAFAGVIGWLLSWIPESVLVPVLVFVALELSTQTLRETQRRHLPAVALALVPAIAQLVLIHWNTLLGALGVDPRTLPVAQRASYEALVPLANGFILTSMIWAMLLIDMIDRDRTRLLRTCLLAAVATAFGVIHSPFADGRLFIPGPATPAGTWALAAGYVLFGCAAWVIDRLDRTR